jgi:hypothetical protein
MRKEEDTMMSLPSFDMLWISYSGDPEGTFSLIIPYCEVTTGEIVKIDSKGISISYNDGGCANVSHVEFKGVIEEILNECDADQGFKRKKIRRLSVQPKNTADVIQLIITQ